MDWTSAPDHIKRLVASIDRTDHLLMASLSLHHPPRPPTLPPLTAALRMFSSPTSGYSRGSDGSWQFLRKPPSACERHCLKSSLPARTDNRLAARKHRKAAKNHLSPKCCNVVGLFYFLHFSFRRGKSVYSAAFKVAAAAAGLHKCEYVSPRLITYFGHTRRLPEVLPAVAE